MHVALGGSGGLPAAGPPTRCWATREPGGIRRPRRAGRRQRDNSFSATSAPTPSSQGRHDFIDAIDGKHDKVINCGGGSDEVQKDRTTPKTDQLLSESFGVEGLVACSLGTSSK